MFGIFTTHLVLLLFNFQFPARLWTVSHSSEHLEGIPSMPSRLNPSKFAPSPTSSPNRVPPLQPYQGPASSLTPGQPASFQDWVPPQMLTQADSQAPAANPYLAGYSQDGQGSQDPESAQQQPHLAWNGLQNPESPFSNRDASFDHWRGIHQNNALTSLAANQMPRHQLDLIPETSERSESLRPSSSNVASTSSSNMLEPFSKTSAPAAVNAAQPQTHQQTNGASHTSGWTHHSSIMQAYQPEA